MKNSQKKEIVKKVKQASRDIVQMWLPALKVDRLMREGDVANIILKNLRLEDKSDKKK